MQKVRTVWLWMLSLWLCGSGLAGAQANPPSVLNHVSFPLRLVPNPEGSGSPLVNLILDRAAHATFVLDTASSNTLIPEHVAHGLGLTPQIVQDEKGKTAMLDATHLLMGIHIFSLVIGFDDPSAQGQLGFECDAVVVPDAVWSASNVHEVDGVLGMNILSHCSLLMDPVAKQVDLWAFHSLTDTERAQVQMQDAEELPLTDFVSEDSGLLQVKVRLNDKVDALLPVDSGSDSTYIPAKQAEQLQLQPTGPALQMYMLTSRAIALKGRLQQIKLGTLICSGPTVYYRKDSKPADQKPETIDGTLGMNVLLHYRMLLDAPNKKFYLKPVPISLPDSSEKKAAPSSKP